MSGNVGLVTNKGSWNALTNAPAISNSTQNNSAGDYYTTSVAGTSSFTSRGKGQYFAVGDIVVFNGAVWTKNDQFSAEAGFGTPSNWKDAYDNHITSGTFANNVITLTQRDGGSFTIDLTGVGGSSVLYRDSVTVLASGGQNAFTLSASIDHEDKTQVFIDGVYQQKTAYSVSGTSLTFDNNVVVPQGSTVEIISFSSVALTESLANAKIFVGDSNANAIARTVSGDATLANTGALTLNASAKTTLGLNNLDNTSDANKPVSTATQTALDLKSNIASPTFTGTVGGITKAMVGLSNVDNTTDASKPVSTATQSALNLKANLAGPTFTGNTSAANLTLSGYLRGPASFVIDPSAHGDDTGTVVIAGNLQVDGTQTTINSTTVSIDDLNLTLASGASSSSAANGAGITIDGASASMLYTHATTNFIFNKPIHIDSTLLVQADNGGVQNATLELIGRQNSAFGGDSRAAKSSIYSETSGAQYSANLVFKTNNSSNSLTERLRLNYNGDAIFSGDTEIITSSTPTLQLTQSGSTNYKGYIKLAGNDLEIRGSSGAMEFYNGSVNGNSSALRLSISSGGITSLLTNQAKTSTSNVEYALLGRTNESTNYSALQLLQKGGASNSVRNWSLQTIEAGVANAGNIVLQPYGGNVGIGKSPSTFRLDLETTSGGNGLKITRGTADFQVFQVANGASYVGTGNADTLHLITGGSSKMSISSGGLVQVGDGTSQNTFLTTKSVAGWYSGIKLTRGLGDGSSTANNNFGMLVTDNGWEVATFTSPSNNATGRSAKLVISSTGYTTFSNDIDTPTVRQGGEIMISRGSNIVRVGSGDGSDSLAFYAGGAQRMSISSNGETTISTTASNAQTALTLSTASSAASLNFSNTGTSPSNWYIQSGGGITGALRFYSNVSGSTGYRMSISSQGVVAVGTTPITDLYGATGSNPFQTLQVGGKAVIGSYKSASGAESMFANNIYVGSTHGTFQAVDATKNGSGVFCYSDRIDFKHAGTAANGSQSVNTRARVRQDGGITTFKKPLQIIGTGNNDEFILVAAGNVGTFTQLLVTIPAMNNPSGSNGYGGYTCEIYIAGYYTKYAHIMFGGYVNNGNYQSEATILRSSGSFSASSANYQIQGMQFTVTFPSTIHPVGRVIFNKSGNGNTYPVDSITATFS